MPGRTEENHKKPQSGQSVSQARFERGIFQIQIRKLIKLFFGGLF
jgi:hypothetical protein